MLFRYSRQWEKKANPCPQAWRTQNRKGGERRGRQARLPLSMHIPTAARSSREHSTVVSTVNSALGSPRRAEHREKEAVHCGVTEQTVRDSDKPRKSWVWLCVATSDPMVCAPNWTQDLGFLSLKGCRLQEACLNQLSP